MERSSEGKLLGYLLVGTFSLLAILFGLALLMKSAHGTWRYSQAATWATVPAKIVALELKNAPRARFLHVRYEYEFVGQHFTGDRVSPFPLRDSKWLKERHEELRPFFVQSRPFECLVNPADPSDAILYRYLPKSDLFTDVFFSVVFLLAGSGGLYLMIWISREENDGAIRQALYPDEPWEWKRAWAGGEITTGVGPRAWLLVFGIVFTVLGLPYPFLAVESESPLSGPAWMMVLLFPSVGIAMLAAWLFHFSRHLKYGVSTLYLQGRTGVIGGRLRGEVFVPRAIDSASGVEASLLCIRSGSARGIGKRRQHVEEILWEARQLVNTRPTTKQGKSTGTGLTVDFSVPGDLPAASSVENTSIAWKLRLSAETPGLDYQAEFDVPVFPTDASHAGIAAAPPVQAKASAPAHAMESVPLDPRHVRVKKSGETLELTFPRRRLWMQGVLLLSVPLILAGLLPLFFGNELAQTSTGFFSGLLPPAWSKAASAVILVVVSAGFGISAFQVLFNETRTVVSKHGIKVVSNYVFFTLRSTVSAAQIEDLAVISDGSFGSLQVYSIWANQVDHHSTSVGIRIPGKAQAETVAELMRQALWPK